MVGYLVVLSLGMVVGAVAAYRSGQLATAAVFAATATGMVHVLALGSYTWRMPRHARRPATLAAVSDGTWGVRFAYSGWPYYLLAASVGSFALALGLALGWVLFTLLRRAPGALTLTPVGLHHHSLTFTHFVPWHAVYAVAAAWSGTAVIVAKAAPSPDTRLRRYAGRFGPQELRLVPFLVVRAYWLATDPVTVYHALSFYYEHPELRARAGHTGCPRPDRRRPSTPIRSTLTMCRATAGFPAT